MGFARDGTVRITLRGVLYNALYLTTLRFLLAREVKWIRKWLSRRRCRSKSRVTDTSVGESSQRDASSEFSRASPAILPPFGFLVPIASPNAVPSRPDYARSVSAPSVPTLPALGQSPRFLLHTHEPHVLESIRHHARSATAPRPVGYQPCVLELPSGDTVSTVCSGPASPLLSASVTEGGTPRMDSQSLCSLSDLAYAVTQEQEEQPPPPLDVDGITNLIRCLQDVAGSSTPRLENEIQPSPGAALTSLQADMLSALGLELATPDTSCGFSLGLEHTPATPVPTPQQACPVSFRIPLEELAAMSAGLFRIPVGEADVCTASASHGRCSQLDFPALSHSLLPVPKLVPGERASAFMDPDAYAVAQLTEEEEDNDEAVTPGDTDVEVTLTDPSMRKASPGLSEEIVQASNV